MMLYCAWRFPTIAPYKKMATQLTQIMAKKWLRKCGTVHFTVSRVRYTPLISLVRLYILSRFINFNGFSVYMVVKTSVKVYF